MHPNRHEILRFMDLKPTYKKPQFLAQIAGAFLVILCCIALPTRVGAFSLSDGLASIASFWQGVTCFFGINCPAAAPETSDNSIKSPAAAANPQVSNNPQTPTNQIQNKNPDIIPDPSENNIIQDPVPSVQPPAQIIQNINPTKEIQTKEIQTVKTIETKTNTVVADQDLRDQVTRLTRQLNSDRPNYSVGQSYALPANLLAATLNIGNGAFTVSAAGDANAQNITAEHDLVVRGNFTVAGAQTYSGAASFTAASANPALFVANTGIGAALQADNITAKTNTINTLTGNLILNSNTGLIEVAGSGIKLTNSVPSDTSMALYNDSGTLKWNGAALALGSSVSGTSGYVPKFTASNALGNSVLFENGGNVGIGTTAPSGKFEIFGDPAAGTTRGDFLVNTATKTVTIGRLSSTAGDNSIFSVVDRVGNTQFKVNSGGPVIGVGGDPVSGVILNIASTYAGGTNGYGLRVNAPIGATNNYAASFMGGNVGIGTTSPTTTLEIASGLWASAQLRIGAINQGGRIGFARGSDAATMFFIGPSAAAANDFGFTSYSGVAPIYFSTNSAERMRIDSTGNVGIGTTAPGYSLDVNGTIQGAKLRGRGTAPSVALIDTGVGNTYVIENSGNLNVRDSSNSYYMSIMAGGNVGIGTTAPAFKLDVNGDINSNGFIQTSLIELSSSVAQIRARGVATPLLFSTNSSERVRIDASGNVGIGPTAPSSRLHLVGADTSTTTVAQIGGSSGVGLVVLNNGKVGIGVSPTQTLSVYGTTYLGGGNIFVDNNSSIFWGDSSNGVAGQNSVGLKLTAGNSEKMRIQSNGNVGIGTTSPVSKLNIAGADGGVTQAITLGTTATNYWQINALAYNSAKGKYDFQIGGNSFGTGDILLNPTNGNVGIGTTDPSKKLDVEGDIAIEGHKYIGSGLGYGASGSPANYATLQMYNGATGYTNLNNQGFGINLQTAGADRLTILNSGNIGVGTANPLQKLEVKGNIWANTGDGTQHGIYASGGDGVGNLLSAGIIGGNNSGGANSYVKFGAYLNNGLGETSYIALTRSGNVGVSTVSPISRLDVNGGNININGGRYIGANVADSFVYDGDTIGHYGLGWFSDSWDGGGATAWLTGYSGIKLFTAGTPRISINAAGNVGIGTTAPATAMELAGNSSYKTFRVSYDAGNYTDYDSQSINMIRNTATSVNMALGFNSNTGGAFTSTGGNITFSTNNAGAYGERLRITTAGNVGIGTASPQQKMHVSGGNIEFDEQQGIYVRRDGADSPIIQFLNTDELRIGVPHVLANNFLTLYTNDNERIRITSSGNVGIGTTSPAYKFHVVGNTYLEGSELVLPSNTSIHWGDTGTGIYANAAGDYITFTSDGTEDMRITTGNVGIGTASPAGKLSVVSGDNDGLVLATTQASAGQGPVMQFNYNGGTGATTRIARIRGGVQSGGGGDIYFETAPSGSGSFGTKMTILREGDVGIGTVSPGYKLDVNGSFNVAATSTFSTRVGIGTTTPGYRLDVGKSDASDGTVVNILGGASGAGLLKLTRTSGINQSYSFGLAAGKLTFYDETNSQYIFSSQYANTGGIGNINQLILGYETGNTANGAPGLLRAPNAGSTGTDTYGGDLKIASGVGRGNGAQSNILFYTPDKVGSGSNEQTYSAKMSILGNGNVGIGTTAPGYLLTVNGTAVASNFISGSFVLNSGGLYQTGPQYDSISVGAQVAGGARPWLISSGDATNTGGYTAFSNDGSETMRIKAGNVGIGTTAPKTKLSVGAPHGNIDSSTGHFGIFQDRAGAYTSSGVGASIGNTGGDFGAVYAYDYANNVAKNLVLNQFGGNVGIGTTAPAGKLDVHTDNYLNEMRWIVDSGTNAGAYATLGSNNAYGRLVLGSSGSSGQLLNTTGGWQWNTQLNIMSHVGIGTNAPENAEGWNRVLDVYGADATKIIATTSAIQTGIWSHNSGFYGAPIGGIVGTKTAHPLTLMANGAARMVISGGNVGIGTTGPTGPLQVHSTGTYVNARFTDAATGATVNDGIAFGYDDSYGGIIWNREASNIVFATSNTEKVRIDSAGNVGIGTTSPGSNLDIVNTSSVDNSFRVARTYNSVSDDIVFGVGDYSGDGGFRGTRIGVTNGLQFYVNKTFGNSVWGAGGTTAMAITSAGNVGIGTLAPNGDLEVAGIKPIFRENILGRFSGNLLYYASEKYSLTTSTTGTASITSANQAFYPGDTYAAISGGAAGGSVTVTVTKSSGFNVGTIASAVYPYIQSHGGFTATIQADLLKQDGVTWTTVYSATSNTFGQDEAKFFGSTENLSYPADFPVKGVRFVISNVTAGSTFYVRQFGFYNYKGNPDDTPFVIQKGPAYLGLDGSYVGIGTASPGYQLTLSTNSAAKPTSDHWTISSDARLKDKVIGIPNALQTVLQLQGKEFEYIDKEKYGASRQYGFIAQEVETVIPRWVQTGSDGFKTLTIAGDTALLVEAIKAQQKEIDSLKLALSPTGALGNASSTSGLVQGGGLFDWLVSSLNSMGLALKDGVASLAGVMADKFTGKRADIENIHTKQICVDGDDGRSICLNRDQLEEVINKSQSSVTTIRNYDPDFNDDATSTAPAAVSGADPLLPDAPMENSGATTTETAL